MKAKLGSILACLVGGFSLSAQTVDTVLATNLFQPSGVVLEQGDNLFVTDSGQHRIVRFTPSSGQLITLAGKAGVSGTNNGTTLLSRFNQPQGIVSARGGLVISDSVNHLIRFVSFGGVVTNIAGAPLTPGSANGRGSNARFNYPASLATDSQGNIYVADTKNGAIRKIDSSDNVTTVASGFFDPAGVTVGENGDIWVADTRRHVIQKVDTNGVVTLIAGTRGFSGSADADHGLLAQFNSPRGLLWVNKTVGLLVADGGGNTIRRVYFSEELNDYVVETFAGTANASAGFKDGPLLSAVFNNPVALARDPNNGGFVVVDRANNALRRIQISESQPPLQDPIIGIVLFPPPDFTSQLFPIKNAVFNNDVIIAVKREEGSEVYFTFGPTPDSNLEDQIPIPTKAIGSQAPQYRDGAFPSQVPPTLIQTRPDFLVKLVSSQDGRRSSSPVTARFQFRTANPLVYGDNAASFTVTNITENSQMFYTVDGSDPTNEANNTTVFGPILSGRTFSFIVPETNLVFKIQAFRESYAPSDVVVKVFSPSNFVANKISFGFPVGEASSEFFGASGQTFYAPVTLSLVANQTIYSLQFNVSVTNLVGPAVTPGAVGFSSLLQKPLEIVGRPPIFVKIPPSMFGGYKTVVEVFPLNDGGFITNYNFSVNTFSNLIFTNFSNNLIGVGWLERRGETNLYNTRSQDLIAFSQAHNTMFLGKNGKVILGGYSFTLPASSKEGDIYQIQVDRPSATEDGIDDDVFIQTVTNNSVRGGSLNAIKHVFIGSRLYIAGDCLPFRWFNAGDFGEGRLLNNDVLQVFQTVMHHLNAPPPASDFLASMDSSNGTTNQFFDSAEGNDMLINEVKVGDGELNVDDLYVTFRRSLDPSLKWFARYWSNGVLNVIEVPNRFSTNDNTSQSIKVSQTTEQTKSAPSAEKPFVTFSADDIVLAGGQRSVSVPIRANIVGSRKIRIMILSLSVTPLGNTPGIETSVSFTHNTDLGVPYRTASLKPDHIAVSWLGENDAPGLSGNTIIGTLNVTLPQNLPSNAVYRVEFEHVSASPNGVGLFPKAVQPGVITVQDSTKSTWNDEIPDSWRLKYFGSLNNLLVLKDADADGDGASNLEEFLSGTDPNDIRSALKMTQNREGLTGRSLRLRWPGISGKRYMIERSDVLTGGTWVPVATNIIGNGSFREFLETNTTAKVQFYRVRTQN